MRAKQRLDLANFDGRLLDGLVFCRRVYDLFEQRRNESDGIAKLRLRPTKDEKRLLEELIPITRYLQLRYCEGRRIKVRWFKGSQPYDAILCSSGALVEHGLTPKQIFIEVTTAVHQNDYLARRLLQERGGSFGVKGISWDKETRQIVSKPYVHTNDELVTDLVGQIVECLKKKTAKKYSPETVLIVNCVPNGLILPSEWSEAIQRVINTQAHVRFREVFLLETVMSHSSTLYGERKEDRDASK